MMFDPRLAAALMMPPAMYDPGSAALALLASNGQTAKLFASPPNRLDDQPKDSKAPSAPPNRANGSNASFRIETLLDQPGPPTTFAPGSSNAATAAMFGIPEPTTMQQQQQMAVQHILAQMGALGPPMPMSMGAAAEHHQQQQQQQGGSCGGNNGTGNRLDLANISPLEATRGDSSPLLARNSSPRSSAPETPSGESSGGGGGKKTRKARTIFTDKQLQELENMFERHKYLSVQDRMDLARRMNLSDTQVKTWYQNRRTKWKRQTQTGQELLQEHNLVAVQQIIRANPHFWAPLMVGQMAAAQQAQHSQFAQRFLSNPAAATFGMASAHLEAAENVQQLMGNGAAIVGEREENNVVNGAEEKPGQQAEGRRKAEKRRADREVAEEEAELLLLEHTKRAKWEPKEEQNGGGGEHHQDGHRQS